MRPSRRRSDRRKSGSSEPKHREGSRFERGCHAVAEADDIAALLAAVRPLDGVSTAPVRSGAAGFDARASATTWILEEGLKVLATRDRQRIVDSWGVPRRNLCPSLVTDGGCDVRIRHAVIAGAARVALLDWLPLSRTDLAVYETGLFRGTPVRALTLLVRPPTIWSIDEALVADHLFPRGRGFEPERFDAIEEYARGRLGRKQLTRLREATARVERQLPVEGFPRASATIGAGCTVIARDDEWCATIAALQLARYASSALVDRVAAASPREIAGGVGAHPASTP